MRCDTRSKTTVGGLTIRCVIEHSIEEWRPVVGWEGFYEVSNQGHVRSLDRLIIERTTGHRYVRPGQPMKTHTIKKTGYVKVCLWRDNRSVCRSVHVLLAEAFIGPRPAPEIDVRHKNGVAWDNRLENLEYGTKSENQQDRKRHGTHLIKAKCVWGHEYTPENTYWIPRVGNRRCRTCLADSRRRRAKRAS